ncbi:MAG: BLUF domain-containing protein [Phycisphaerales bacterium]
MGSSQIFQLVYVSVSSRPMVDQELHAIQTAAVKNNRTNDVTGVLLYNNGCFLQLLEGSRDALAKTYGRIATDSRHVRPSVLYYQRAEKRVAESWSMGVLNMDRLTSRSSIEDLLERFRAESEAVTSNEKPVETLMYEFERLSQENEAIQRASA